MKINQLKSGVIISYLTQAINIISGLIYTPVMLRLLGQSEYGLYQLVYSVVSYLSLLSLGFSSSYVRFFSRYNVNGDKKGIARLNGMFFVIFVIISFICILAGSFLAFNAEAVFGNGLTVPEIKKAKILMEIMVINMALTFINSVFTSILTAHEQFFFQRIIEFLKALFNPFLTLPLLILGYGSVGMVTITAVLTVAALAVNIFFCLKKLRVKFCFKKIDFALLKEMFSFTFYIFVNMIVDQLNWSVDKFLLGRMMGTVAVAIYGVAGQLNSMYLTFSRAVSSVFIPRVNRIVVENENNTSELTELFTKVGRIQFLILFLIISGFILFGKEFIFFWAGKGYDEAYIIGLFLLVPVTVPMIQNLGIEIQRAKNMHKARSVIYLLIAISNIFISIPCIKHFGASGAAIGTAISVITGNGIFMNWYYHKAIHMDMKYFWKNIMKIFIPACLALLIGIGIKFIINCGTLFSLVAAIALYSIVYSVSVYFIGMNSYEKKLINVPLKKIFGRKHVG